MAMTKQDLLKIIEALPDDVSPDVILEEIRFRVRTEQAIASLEAGQGIPDGEAARRIDGWLNKDTDLIPDELVELTGESDLNSYVLGLIVLDLYRRGRLSAGRSSELLKLSRAESMELADLHKIPIASYTPEEAAQERKRWDTHRRSIEAGP